MPLALRRVLAALSGLVLGAMLGLSVVIKAPAEPLFEGYLARPHCADLVAQQIATDKTVKGSFGCLGGLIGAEAQMVGIGNDSELATVIGQPGAHEWYRGRTSDGAYVYEVDDQLGQSTLYSIYVDGSGRVAAVR